LLLLSLALNLYGIDWGLPNGDIDWAPDSLAPLGPLSYAKRLLYLEPWFHKYPPLHFIVLAIVYSPYVLYLALTGQFGSPRDVFPYGLTHPEFALTVFTLLARMISALMGTGTVLINYAIVRTLYGARAALIAGFLMATAYPIIHYSHSARLDIPQLFWLSLALYSYILLLKNPQTKYYLLLGLFTALALATKLSIYALILGLLPALFWYHVVYHRAERDSGTSLLRLVFHRKILFGFAISIVMLVVIFNPFSNWAGLMYQIDYHSLRSVRGSWVIRDAPTALQGHIELLYYYLTYLVQTNGVPAFILIAAGFLYGLLRFPRQSLFVLIPIVFYYLFFLRIHGTHHLRYMLPVYLLLTWQAGKVGADWLAWRSIPKAVRVGTLVLILGYTLLYGLTVDVMYGRDPRYTAEAWMAKHIATGTTVLGIHPEYSLPRFPRGLAVERRALWNYQGEQIADITDVDAQYVVIGMSIPRRQRMRAQIETFFRERGYHEVASFKSRLPFFGAEIPDLHDINPLLVVLHKSRRHSGTPSSPQRPQGASDALRERGS